MNVSADTEYRLGSGDTISIQVFGEDDLSMDIRVSNQEKVSYPFLGQIHVLNQTIAAVEQEISNGLKDDYLIEPRVSVSITEYRPFFIAGEVEEPGGYPFQPGLTLRKAITLAGGFTERASKSKIYLDDQTKGQGRELIDLDYQVKPDDVITIEQSFF